MKCKKLTHTFTSEEMLDLIRLDTLLHSIEEGRLRLDEDSQMGIWQRRMLKDGQKVVKTLLDEKQELIDEYMKTLKAGH